MWGEKISNVCYVWFYACVPYLKNNLKLFEIPGKKDITLSNLKKVNLCNELNGSPKYRDRRQVACHLDKHQYYFPERMHFEQYDKHIHLIILIIFL